MTAVAVALVAAIVFAGGIATGLVIRVHHPTPRVTLSLLALELVVVASAAGLVVDLVRPAPPTLAPFPSWTTVPGPVPLWTTAPAATPLPFASVDPTLYMRAPAPSSTPYRFPGFRPM